MKRVPQRKGALLPVYRQLRRAEQGAAGDTGDAPTCTLDFLHVRPAATVK